MTISFFVSTLAQVLILAIIIRSLLSFFPGVRALQPVSMSLNEALDPLLRPIQQRMRPLGGLDFSPMIAILLIAVIETVLLSLLAGH
jgi:YggT family protein